MSYPLLLVERVRHMVPHGWTLRFSAFSTLSTATRSRTTFDKPALPKGGKMRGPAQPVLTQKPI